MKLITKNNTDLHTLYDKRELIREFPDVVEKTHLIRGMKVYEARSANSRCTDFFVWTHDTESKTFFSPYLRFEGWIVYSSPSIFMRDKSEEQILDEMRSEGISEEVIKKVIESVGGVYSS